MEKASQDLIKEHNAILLVLKSLEKITSQLKESKKTDKDDLLRIVDFLKGFADKCHHGKEEGLFFPALEEAGIRKENGPIGVMLYEHEKGRELIRQMSEALAGTGIDTELFTNASTSYINLLRNHIEKENNILFPMGDSRLSDEKNRLLLEKFETFEEEVMGKGVHHKYHMMIEEFEKKYQK